MSFLKYLAAFFFIALPATAQVQPGVQQFGTVTANHVATWKSNGFVQDGGAPAGGTVTSVGVTGDGIIFNSSFTGSPITSSGTFNFNTNLISHSGNLFLSTPNGTSGTPTFRAINSADLPIATASTLGVANFPINNGLNISAGAVTLSAPTISVLGGILAASGPASNSFVTYVDTSGLQHVAQPTFGNISGTLGIGQGGTALTTLGSAGTCLQVNGGGTALVYASCALAGNSFNGLTSGNNTSATMTVGTGASLGPAGSGTITATAMPASGLTGTSLPVGITTASGLTTAAGGLFGTAAYDNTGTSGATIPLLNGNNVASGTNQFSGLVGMGAAPAAYQLKVVNASVNEAYFGSTGVNNAAIILDNAGAGNEDDYTFWDGGASKWSLTKTSTNTFQLNDRVGAATFLTAVTSGNLTLGPAQSTVINQSGQVGIGATPVGSDSLTVVQAGASPVYVGSTGSNAATIHLDNQAGGNSSEIILDNAGVDKYFFGMNNASQAFIEDVANSKNFFTGISGGDTILGLAQKLFITVGGGVESTPFTANSGTSLNVNIDNGPFQIITITGAVAIGFTTPTHPGKATFKMLQDVTGHVYSMASCTWSGGTAPTYSTAANVWDIISVIYDGSAYSCTASVNF